MKTYNNLTLSSQDNILIVTIARPSKMNALNIETVGEIRDVMQAAFDDDSIRGIILTGEGQKAFVAGADISEIAQLNELNGRQFAERGQEVFNLIEFSNKPVIAAVNGFALGGGCELAMACHIRIASDNARFGQPEVNLGIIPGYGGTQRLTQLVGKGKALELMMTGDMITAEEARALGLVNHVTTQEELMPKALMMMEKILSKAPLAIGLIVDCVSAVFDKEADGYQTEANAFSRCIDSKDFIEGTSAFLEKRKPAFSGN